MDSATNEACKLFRPKGVAVGQVAAGVAAVQGLLQLQSSVNRT